MDWKLYKRHPLSAEYGDLAGPAWERFVAGLKRFGCRGRSVILHENMVLDGWQLYRACVAENLQPNFEVCPEGIPPEEYVEIANDNRRHETEAVIGKRVVARRKRVLAARLNGESLRSIADAEGVSVGQVQRDLAGVSPDTPGPSNTAIKGKDGKRYPSKPKKPKPTPEPDPDKMLDEVDNEVPAGLASVFTRAAEFREIVNQLNAINRQLEELRKHPAGACLTATQADLRNLKEAVRFAAPYAVCPVCSGVAKTRKANCPCKQRGWLIEGAYKNLPAEYRK